MKLLALVAIMTTLGCSTLQGFLFPEARDKDTKVAWEKDMKMEVNGVTYYGTAVVPKSDVYTIKIFPAFKEIDRIQWRTCHRGGHADLAVRHGRWPWSRKQQYFTLTIKPRDIEMDRACTLNLEALTRKRKNMSFGMVVFPDSRSWMKLGGTLECNGVLHVMGGTSLCQSPWKAIQRIAFKPGVIQDLGTDDVKQCVPMKEITPGVFEYYMPKSRCVYQFISPDKDESGRYIEHKLITFGYEKTPPDLKE